MKPIGFKRQSKRPLEKPNALCTAKVPGFYAVNSAWIIFTIVAILLAVPCHTDAFQELGLHQWQKEQQIAILGVTMEDGNEIGTIAYLVVTFVARADSSGLAVVFPRVMGRLSPMAETSIQQAIYRAARVAELSTDSWSVMVSVLQSGLIIH